MSFPTFSVSSGPTVVLSRGRVFPSSPQYDANQIRQEAEDGSVTAVELGPDIVFLHVELQGLPRAEWDALLAFLQHALVRWGLYVFSFIDEEAITYSVRYWGPFPLVPQETAAGYFDVSFLLRVEA
jgi:hypothetical protein